MSFNDDFMDFIGCITNGTGELPEDDAPDCDEEDEEE